MLKRLRFENFKSWPIADIEFGPITALFGTNSSGKTSLIQFLLLLKQTKNATDRAISLDLNGSYVSLGVYRDVIHKHNESKALSWDLSIELPKDLVIADPSGNRAPLIRSKDLRIESEVKALELGVVSTKLIYTLGGPTFALLPKGSSEKEFELSTKGSNFSPLRTKGRTWPLHRPVKSYAFPDQARTYYQNTSFLSDIEDAYEKEMDRIYYLGPLRDDPKRDYLWARSSPQDVGIRGDKAIDVILAATAARQLRNAKAHDRRKPFQEMVAYWLRDMGLIYDFRVEEIAPGSNRWQAKVQTREGGTEVLLTDVGFDVSQVLPVITLLQFVPEDSIVILEQPEIHLHPLAQANLADVIINACLHRKLQIIVESHSEHMLLRLQRRIAESEIAAQKVKLFFCDAPEGISRLEPLGLDLYGQISNWPKNFMGDAFGETYEAEKARLQRMKAAE